ncbi:MAG: hypothetical protein JWR39_2416 [Devosia sp.]|nr:hypothetical protein [Devosia sp.]
MRICIDLDGTICEYKSVTGDYATVRPLPYAAQAIRDWRAQGHYIILNTARHMKTTNGNVGMVLARQAKILFAWLDQHGIEYDEINFGKPHADLYLDDNAMRFDGNWETLVRSDRWNRPSMEKAGKINIVVTMAGAGSRFRSIGHSLPKPLIPAFGEPMYRHAARSLPLHLAEKLIFIILDDEHAELLEADIASEFAPFNPITVRIPQITRGQAETLLAAEPEMAFNLPVLVHNADSAFVCSSFEELYLTIDGGLHVFNSSEERWSYARTDEQDRVVEVREKVVISDKASTGTYYFRSSVQAFELAGAAVENNETERGEFYIAPLFNKMIAARQNVRVIPVEAYVCYGTPADLSEAEAEPSNGDIMERLKNLQAAAQ